MTMALSTVQLICTLALALPLVYTLSNYLRARKAPRAPASNAAAATAKEQEKPKSIMQAEKSDLAPPGDRVFRVEELAKYTGVVDEKHNPDKLIYVAIKGTVFDVTAKAVVYGPGQSYGLFAGKDASRALGMSSLKEEDALAEWGDITDDEKKVLADWHAFFSKRYNIIGKVDLGEALNKFNEESLAAVAPTTAPATEE